MTTRSHGYAKDSQRVVGLHSQSEARCARIFQKQKAIPKWFLPLATCNY